MVIVEEDLITAQVVEDLRLTYTFKRTLQKLLIEIVSLDDQPASFSTEDIDIWVMDKLSALEI